MKYVFTFFSRYLEILNYTLALCKQAKKIIKDKLEIIGLFFKVIFLFFISVVFFIQIGYNLSPFFNAVFWFYFVIGVMAFFAFSGLLLTRVFPNSISNEKNINYYFDKMSNCKNETINDVNDIEVIIRDREKWSHLLSKLKESKIIDNKNTFVGLGPNFSKLPTQLGVMLFALNHFKIVDNNINQNIQTKAFSKYFGVNLTPARYSQIIKTFEDEKGIHKNMEFYYIYQEIISYL